MRVRGSGGEILERQREEASTTEVCLFQSYYPYFVDLSVFRRSLSQRRALRPRSMEGGVSGPERNN
jgi:hypothetical protein